MVAPYHRQYGKKHKLKDVNMGCAVTIIIIVLVLICCGFAAII